MFGRFSPVLSRLLIFACAFGPAALWADTPAGPPRVLRAAVESHSAPLTFADNQGQPSGFAVELLQAVAREQGLTIQYQVMDWPDLLAAFKAGEIDIVCNIGDTPERHAFAHFSGTTLQMRGAMFRRRDTPPIKTLADLRGRKLALPRDSRAHDYFRTHDYGVEFVFAPTIKDCIDAVNEGRAELILATQLVAQHIVRQGAYNNVVSVNLAFPDFDYRLHFGVQPAAHELLAQLNEGLLTLSRNGTYDQLYEKWLGPLQPRQLRWRDVRSYVLPLLVVIALGIAGLVWQRRVLKQISEQAEALRRSEERLSLVIEGSQDGIWDWDVAAGKVTRSPRWNTMLGYEPDEIGQDQVNFTELVHPDDRVQLESDVRAVWAGRDQFAEEFRLKAKDGSWKWILDRGKVVARDPKTGLPLRLAGTHTDITARKRAEEENDKLQRKMVDAQKLESLGVLAGGIAHDFNNLLTVILGNTALLRLDVPSGTETARHLDKTLVAANRAADLCRQLLAYAGKGTVVVGPTDINELVTESTRLLELSLTSAQLSIVLTPSLPPVDADPTQLRQVVMNLVTNASEALGEAAGNIRLATSVVTLLAGDLPNARPTSEIASGNYVCLEVADDGCGMSADVQARIFDPFYSTKFSGRGLGLPAVVGIVRAHHGALTVESAVGRGSTFRIYLPVSKRVI
jgi:PAS domain S-box-containing protein